MQTPFKTLIRSRFAALATLALLAAPSAAHVGVLAPNGGEVFVVGDQVTIQWTVLISHNTQDWDIFYSTTGAAPWSKFHMNIPPVGSTAVGTIHDYTATITPELVGSTTRFRVRMDNVTGTDYYDKSDADFTVLSGPWENLGFGLAGTNGVATLVGTGDLTAGSNNSVDLANAAPNSTAFVFLGTSAGNAPFKGGTLVPIPILLTLPVPTDAEGAVSLPFVWPAGVPSGAQLFIHAWFADTAGPSGAAASDALQATAP